MALDIGESHILASHSGVGKAGGAEPSGGPRIYNNLLDVDRELKVQMGTQAHFWWASLINWCVVSNQGVSRWLVGPEEKMERARKFLKGN